MTNSVYIGNRYVPMIMGQWDNTKQYEGLSVVLYQGASYTSRKIIPPGIDIKNEEYWALTGNYNAQVEQYRQEVNGFDARITGNTGKLSDHDVRINNNDTNITQNRIDLNKVIQDFDRTIYLADLDLNDIAGSITSQYQEVPENQVFKVPSGQYNLTSPLKFDRKVFLDMRGVEFIYSGIEYAITLGSETFNIDSFVYTLPKITKSGSVNWFDEVHGIRNVNIYNSYLFLDDVTGFKNGLVTDAMNGKGNAYNNYFFKRMVNNLKSVTLTSSLGGWSNESNYISGRFGITSDMASRVSSENAHIYIQYKDYSQNNNRFLGMSFESGTGKNIENVAIIEDGRMIYFRDCRYEGIHNFDIRKGTDIQVTYGFGASDLIFPNLKPQIFKSHNSESLSNYNGFTFNQNSTASNDIMKFQSVGQDRAFIKGDGTFDTKGSLKFLGSLEWGGSDPSIKRGLLKGSGSPVNSVNANIGSIYSDYITGRLYTKNAGGNDAIGWRGLQDVNSGFTSGRPANVNTGYMYFDTTLNKPIWFNGTNWVDVTGTTV